MTPKTIKPLHSPILLPNFNQIWSFSTGFHKRIQYQISRTDVHDEADRRFSRL